MSFLRNLSKILLERQRNTRGIFCARPLLQEGDSYLKTVQEDWVDEDPKDRSNVVDVETSIRYMNSEAYKKSYGDEPVWTMYRRNKVHHFLTETRKTCIRKNKISTASPCPICRDMYLVLHHRNVKLLEQFISPHSGEILPSIKTGLCQKQHLNLVLAVMRAKDYGIISYDVPFIDFDYEHYKELSKKYLKEYKALKQH